MMGKMRVLRKYSRSTAPQSSNKRRTLPEPSRRVEGMRGEYNSEHAADCPNLSFEELAKLHNRLKDDLLDSAAMVAVGFRFADPYIHETI
jgi:hypothetical protein